MDEMMLQQIRDVLLARSRQFISRPHLHAVGDQEEHENQTEIIDIAQNLEQLDRDSSLAEQERRELLAVEHALGKLMSGSFGVCEDCAEEIPHKRLLVVPEARLCANCQSFYERQTSRSRVAGASR